MGVKTFTEEIACPIAPARLFKAMMFENDHLLPKLLPQEIKSVEIVHGNGEVGTIKQTNFVEGGPFKCMKHRLDAIDEANFSCKYCLIGGDVLPVDKLEKVSHEIKIETAGAGCVVKSKIHFHIKGDIVLPEEELKANKEKAMGTFKAVEAYLISNLLSESFDTHS